MPWPPGAARKTCPADHRKTIGKPWKTVGNGGLMGFNQGFVKQTAQVFKCHAYPLVICEQFANWKIAIEIVRCPTITRW